jgi:nitroreductase
MKRIVECGLRAPTGGNSQLYTIVEVKKDTLRKKITEICHNQEFIYEASHYFVVCADIRRMEQVIQQAQENPECALEGSLTRLLFGVMDASFVAQNMVVAAEALGYTSIYIGSVTNKIAEVSALLELPKGVLPVVGLAIGVPAEHPPLRPRLPREMLWQVDCYRDPAPETLMQAMKDMDTAMQQEGYYKKYGLNPSEEYLWSTHMCKKFSVENLAKTEQKQKEDLQQQGFLENI